MDDDIRQLDLLGTFHYVVAGILALFGLFPIFHLIMGIAIFTGAFDAFGGAPGDAPPDWFGLIFIVFSLMMMACMWALAAAVWLAGKRLKRRTNHTYCLVVAALECMFTPFGTVLGVLTIIVLVRPSVRSLFGLPLTASS